MPKKRVAIVGLGKIGLFHLSLLKNFEEVEVVGLVDEKSSVQKTVGGMGVHAPFFDDVEKMIASIRPDAVFACVPPAFNLPVAEACVRNNVSVFVEKPMAQGLEEAKKMAGLLNGRDPKPANAVGYMVAYYPTFRHAREILGQKLAGEIRHYSASLLLGEVFKKQEGWRQNPKISGGGAVAVLGSHLLYLIQSLFGLPSRVAGRTFKLFSDVEDLCQATLEHPGFSGEFNVSWSRPGFDEMTFQIHAEGTAGFIEITENCLSFYAFEGHPKFPPGWKVWYPWDFPKAAPPGKVQFSQQGYASQDDDFIKSIGTGRELPVSWSQGLKVQRMIEGLYRSASSSGQMIHLPD